MKGETDSQADEGTIYVSPSKSKFADLIANLEKSGNVNICSGIDDFYRQQKASKVGDTKRKGEAASQLHHFRGSVDDVKSPTKKSAPIRNPIPHEENGAANRAAAALFVCKSPKRTSSKANGSSTVVRSLGDFYSQQRSLRRKENATRKKATDLYRGYSGLVSRLDPAASYVVRSPIKAVSDTITKINEASPLVPKFNLSDSSFDTSIENPIVAVDYKRSDYRAFVFVVHDKHGLMLLHCTRKPKKGPHYQLAGGHVDEHEFLAAAKKSSNANGQLLYAAKMGAARELYEETGMDVRSQLDRLEPAVLRRGTEDVDVLNCELSKRLYFYLSVTDADFSFDDDSQKLKAPLTDNGNHLRLRLSIEHSGFVFESDPQKSAKMLEKHSGGNGSKALLMSILSMKQKESKTETPSMDKTETQLAENDDPQMGENEVDTQIGENDVDTKMGETDVDTQTSEISEDAQTKDTPMSEPVFSGNPVVAVDYEEADYRGFVFVVHEKHGLMLLHCTSKPKKGPHHQLPGGHIDAPEFLAAARSSEDAHAQLMIAAQMGAARELFEETAMDVREKLYRLEPAALRSEITTDKNGKLILTCELKKRLYFFLPVTDEDYISVDSVEDPTKLTAPMTEEGSHLRLLLSNEHSGFMFEKYPEKSAKLLEQHSGGNGSKALLMALNREAEEEADKAKNEDTQVKAESTSEDNGSVDPVEEDQKEKEESEPDVKEESEVHPEANAIDPSADSPMASRKEDQDDDMSGVEETQMTGGENEESKPDVKEESEVQPEANAIDPSADLPMESRKEDQEDDMSGVEETRMTGGENEESEPDVKEESEVQPETSAIDPSSDLPMESQKEDQDDDMSGVEETQMTGEPTTEDFDYNTRNQHLKDDTTTKLDERNALLSYGSHDISFENLPCDLLPPPAKKNIFTCCLFCGNKD